MHFFVIARSAATWRSKILRAETQRRRDVAPFSFASLRLCASNYLDCFASLAMKNNGTTHA
jgi:hypothetical protein